MILKDYIEKIKANSMDPNKLCEIHLELATTHATYSDMLIRLMSTRAKEWKQFIDEHKSVSRAEKECDNSECGVKIRQIKIMLNSLEKLLSSLRRNIDGKELEAKNMW